MMANILLSIDDNLMWCSMKGHDSFYINLESELNFKHLTP